MPSTNLPQLRLRPHVRGCFFSVCARSERNQKTPRTLSRVTTRASVAELYLFSNRQGRTWGKKNRTFPRCIFETRPGGTGGGILKPRETNEKKKRVFFPQKSHPPLVRFSLYDLFRSVVSFFFFLVVRPYPAPTVCIHRPGARIFNTNHQQLKGFPSLFAWRAVTYDGGFLGCAVVVSLQESAELCHGTVNVGGYTF